MPGSRSKPARAVDRESGYLRTEFGAETDVGLRGHTLGELRQHTDELGVDRAAVVALHEVLDDQLPVGRHVVDDAMADIQAADAVAVDGVGVAEPSWSSRRSRPRTAAGRRTGTPRRSRATRSARPAPGRTGTGRSARRSRRSATRCWARRPACRPARTSTSDTEHRRVRFTSPSGFGAQLGAAVPADVQERPQQSVATAHQQHALAADLDLPELARGARDRTTAPRRTTWSRRCAPAPRRRRRR